MGPAEPCASFGILMNHGPVAQLVGSSLTRGCCAPVASPQIQCARARLRGEFCAVKAEEPPRGPGAPGELVARATCAPNCTRVFSRDHGLIQCAERASWCRESCVARAETSRVEAWRARARACARVRACARSFARARLWQRCETARDRARPRVARARDRARARNGAAICVFFILAIARARGCEHEAIAALAWNSEHCLSARNVELVRPRGLPARSARARTCVANLYGECEDEDVARWFASSVSFSFLSKNYCAQSVESEPGAEVLRVHRAIQRARRALTRARAPLSSSELRK